MVFASKKGRDNCMISVQENQAETNIKGKDLLSLADISSEAIKNILELAVQLKKAYLAGEETPLLKGKILGMIFDKNSTRTRVSFEAGMAQLGGQALYLNGKELQLGRGEPISDTAKVLSQYIDAIMIRTFSHKNVEELALHASIPIINGLTDLYHPCQALADLLTMKEVYGKLEGLKIAYVGDGNNVAHDLMLGAAKVGIHIAVATPKGYEPNAEITELVKQYASVSGSEVILTNDPFGAVKDADAIYTDVWTSMGQEEENEQRMKDFQGFQVNSELLNAAKAECIFLHCLPAHRGEEVTAEVIDGKQSYVFQQAGNRMHAQKALLVEILK